MSNQKTFNPLQIWFCWIFSTELKKWGHTKLESYATILLAMCKQWRYCKICAIFLDHKAINSCNHSFWQKDNFYLPHSTDCTFILTLKHISYSDIKFSQNSGCVKVTWKTNLKLVYSPGTWLFYLKIQIYCTHFSPIFCRSTVQKAVNLATLEKNRRKIRIIDLIFR